MSTQATPILSSGEAELLATVKAGSTALGVKSMAQDLGDVIEVIKLGTDSGAARGIASRVSLGKVRASGHRATLGAALRGEAGLPIEEVSLLSFIKLYY